MEIKGWYYLHVNNELIYKSNPDAIADIRDSDLCHSAWAFYDSRGSVWSMVIEAASLGANPSRIAQLLTDWNLTDEDATIYAAYVGVVLGNDGDKRTATRKDFINIQENAIGFGGNYFEAMVDLCKKLGYKGGKMWETTFKDLLVIDERCKPQKCPGGTRKE